MSGAPDPPCPWGPYRETTLLLRDGAGTLRVDLARSIGAAARAGIERLAGGSFAIVTAYNPYFLARGATDDAGNRAAHERLRSELTARGFAHVEADGHANAAPGHVERGFAVRCGADAARGLACEFGQDAYFWYEDGAFWILPALESRKPGVRLGA